MKKMFRVVLEVFIICLLITSCSDSGTNPESKRMRIYARLTNSFDVEGDREIDSEGYISVAYYPAVSHTSFILDGLNIYEDDEYGMTWSSWEHYEHDNPWLTNRTYELEITANNGDYKTTGYCELPESFIINEDLLPEEINPWHNFTLNWSNCENETNFILYYNIFNDEMTSLVDSLIILEPNSNTFTFTSYMLNIVGAYSIRITLTAIIGPAITPNSEGNFTGDGDGYFYGEYKPGDIWIAYLNTRKDAFNEMNRIKREKNTIIKADEILKKYLGF